MICKVIIEQNVTTNASDLTKIQTIVFYNQSQNYIIGETYWFSEASLKHKQLTPSSA